MSTNREIDMYRICGTLFFDATLSSGMIAIYHNRDRIGKAGNLWNLMLRNRAIPLAKISVRNSFLALSLVVLLAPAAVQAQISYSPSSSSTSTGSDDSQTDSASSTVAPSSSLSGGSGKLIAQNSSPAIFQDPSSSSQNTSSTPTTASPNPQDTKAPSKNPLEGLDKDTLAKLAQLIPSAKSSNSRQSLPTLAGTVQIKRSFEFPQKNDTKLIHNLSFRDTPVREVIGEIARQGNLNIIIDKSVIGKVTGELRDVTLDEAMDNVMSASGLQTRVFDNHTVIVGTPEALFQLGLNRPVAQAFKLSYAHPHDVATMLQASVFNRGFSTTLSDASQSVERGESSESNNKTEVKNDQTASLVRATTKVQIQEGVGYNNAAIDPGTQQIRTLQELVTDYPVLQNGGGAIVIPDAHGRQVFVVGTSEDVEIAREAISILDRRPKMVHIQASLIELTNQGIRQLGATINVQGQGVSASIMGNSSAPLLSFLPGLGSVANGIPNSQIPSIPFTGTNVTQGTPGTAFTGLVGSLLPTIVPSIAGVTPSPSAFSGVDFLTLGGSAGGKANIATLPTAVDVNLQMLLQTNKAKVIANPSVVVVDNTEALITIANEVVHKVTSTVSLGVVTTNVELAKAGVFLNVLPRITEDGFIRLRLRPQVSAPLGPATNFGSDASLLSIRDVISQEVRIKDGQTLVIGGLFTEQEASQMAKVPYLAELPVLGAFFRTTLKGRSRVELMLMITPKLVEEDPTQLSETGESPTM